MSRRAAALLLLMGCAGDPAAPQRDTDAATSAGADTSGDPATSTGPGPDTTDSTSSGDASTSLDPTVPPLDSTTGEPICAATYAWGGAAAKDIVVVIAADPAALGGLDIDALHAWARTTASDAGHHVAVAAAPTGNEPPPGDGYAVLEVPAGDDPLEIATAVQPDAGFLRAHTPLRLVVVTDVDTVWDADMLRTAAGAARFAQIDARVVLPAIAGCDAITELAELTSATSGSMSCTTALAPEGVLDAEEVLAEQPACTLVPMGEPPPLDVGAPTLALHGIAPAGPQAEFPEGPVACRTAPLGWTIADAGAAIVGLCPARCRAVASWYVAERLTAEVAHECPG